MLKQSWVSGVSGADPQIRAFRFSPTIFLRIAGKITVLASHSQAASPACARFSFRLIRAAERGGGGFLQRELQPRLALRDQLFGGLEVGRQPGGDARRARLGADAIGPAVPPRGVDPKSGV